MWYSPVEFVGRRVLVLAVADFFGQAVPVGWFHVKRLPKGTRPMDRTEFVGEPEAALRHVKEATA